MPPPREVALSSNFERKFKFVIPISAAHYSEYTNENVRASTIYKKHEFIMQKLWLWSDDSSIQQYSNKILDYFKPI